MHPNMLRRHHQSFTEFSFTVLISLSCFLFFLAATFNSRFLLLLPGTLVESPLTLQESPFEKGGNFITGNNFGDWGLHGDLQSSLFTEVTKSGLHPNFSLPFGLFLGFVTQNLFFLL